MEKSQGRRSGELSGSFMLQMNSSHNRDLCDFSTKLKCIVKKKKYAFCMPAEETIKAKIYPTFKLISVSVHAFVLCM